MEENNCQFVSSHGIAKMVDQIPSVQNTKLFTYNFQYVNNYGETIYVHTPDLEMFFQNFADKFQQPFVLVSGNDIKAIPEQVPKAKEYILHPKLLHWWIQNYTGGLGPKAHFLPLGMDYHTLQWNLDHQWGKQQNPKKQEQSLLKIKKNMIPIQNTISTKAIANFQTTTYGEPNLREKRRAPILEILKKKSCVEFLPEQKRDAFWQSMCFYAYVICPPGFGYDTHRTWETLMMGRIPIIQASPIDKVYTGLPVLRVKDWNVIDEEWLHNNFNAIVSKWDSYEWDRLNLTYWQKRMTKI
jgi:hypothetical protein